jgi:hypothetical protein
VKLVPREGVKSERSLSITVINGRSGILLDVRRMLMSVASFHRGRLAAIAAIVEGRVSECHARAKPLASLILD